MQEMNPTIGMTWVTRPAQALRWFLRGLGIGSAMSLPVHTLTMKYHREIRHET